MSSEVPKPDCEAILQNSPEKYAEDKWGKAFRKFVNDTRKQTKKEVVAKFVVS